MLTCKTPITEQGIRTVFLLEQQNHGNRSEDGVLRMSHGTFREHLKPFLVEHLRAPDFPQPYRYSIYGHIIIEDDSIAANEIHMEDRNGNTVELIRLED